jgi:hypothetical protein
MVKAMKWRIYYDDGSTFSDEDGPPEMAPGLGVQIIVDPHPSVGRRMLHSHDYYWHGGGWQGGDIFGFWDYLQRPGLKVVKFGRTIATAAFDAIYRRAKTDPGFPAKSAKLPGGRGE